MEFPRKSGATVLVVLTLCFAIYLPAGAENNSTKASRPREIVINQRNTPQTKIWDLARKCDISLPRQKFKFLYPARLCTEIR